MGAAGRAGLLAALLTCSAALSGVAEPAAPLARVENGQVTACGFVFAVGGHGVELALDRTSSGTRARLSSEGALAVGISRSGGEPDCRIGRQGDGVTNLDRGAVAVLFRDVAIGGAVLCRRDGGGTARAAIPGPLPQQARALFLNCSGDLYRQSR